jgi:hypothetical protein
MSHALMLRILEIVDRCERHDMMFTHDELQQILLDAPKVFTPDACRLIRALVKQANEALTS